MTSYSNIKYAPTVQLIDSDYIATKVSGIEVQVSKNLSLSQDITIGQAQAAFSLGPFEIDSGNELVIDSGGRYVLL